MSILLSTKPAKVSQVHRLDYRCYHGGLSLVGFLLLCNNLSTSFLGGYGCRLLSAKVFLATTQRRQAEQEDNIMQRVQPCVLRRKCQ